MFHFLHQWEKGDGFWFCFECSKIKTCKKCGSRDFEYSGYGTDSWFTCNNCKKLYEKKKNDMAESIYRNLNKEE